MAKFVTSFVLRRILKETVDNNFGKKDERFESIPTKKLNHDAPAKFTANKKKLRKALPPGLTETEQEVLVKVKRRAYQLDMSFGSFLGLRFGWSSVIGVVPAIGDVIDVLLALMVVRTCSEIGLPAAIYIRMIFNIVLDFLVGLVPFLGDLADAAYKANTRNAIILENYLRGRGVENLRQQGMPLPTDYSLPEEWEQQQGLQQQGGAAPGPSGVSGAGSSSRRDRREADVEAQRGGSKKSTKVSEVSRPTQAPTNSKSSKSKSSSRR